MDYLLVIMSVTRFLNILTLVTLFKQSSGITYSISGFSSGGFMATQMHVAYSGTIIGVGLVGSGPYYCSMGSSARVQTACTMNSFLIDVGVSTSFATSQAADQKIDPLSNLQNTPVFIFSGKQDIQVYPGVVEKQASFYSNFVSPASLHLDFDMDTSHTWPTISSGNPCWYFGPPYIGACGFDAAGAILQYSFSALISKGTFNSSNLFEFDQAEYADVWTAGLSSRGWVYAPSFCRSAPIKCRMHMHLHGCLQNYDNIGSVFAQESGFAEWAETNNLVILFPQTVAGRNNPNACWDFDGYTGPDWTNQKGVQMSSLQQIALNYTSIVQNLRN
jgi:predicted esterase